LWKTSPFWSSALGLGIIQNSKEYEAPKFSAGANGAAAETGLVNS
jgi:hypothetical protein